MLGGKEYLKELKKRARTSHIYRKHQLLGLEIAVLLKDEKHKALYMKLARERGGEDLIALAKSIAEKKNILNKGAYFMACLVAKNKLAVRTGGRRKTNRQLKLRLRSKKNGK